MLINAQNWDKNNLQLIIYKFLKNRHLPEICPNPNV